MSVPHGKRLEALERCFRRREVVSRQVVEWSSISPEFTTAWTLTRPWTERAPSTASWKTTERFSTSAHTDSLHAIDARISWAVGGNAGAESCFIDSTLK